MKSQYKSFLVIGALSAVFALSGCSNAAHRATPNVTNNAVRTQNVTQRAVNRTHNTANRAAHRTQTTAQRAMNHRMANNAVTGHGYGYSSNNHRNTVINPNTRHSVGVRGNALANSVVTPNSMNRNTMGRNSAVIVPPMQSTNGITKVTDTRNVGHNGAVRKAAPKVEARKTSGKPANKVATTLPKTAAINHAAAKNKAAVAPAAVIGAPISQSATPRLANNINQAGINNRTTQNARINANRSLLSDSNVNLNRNLINNSSLNAHNNLINNLNTNRNFNANNNNLNTSRSFANNNNLNTSRDLANNDLNIQGNMLNRELAYSRNFINNNNLNTNRNLANNDLNIQGNMLNSELAYSRNFVNRSNAFAMDSYYNDGYDNVVAPVSSVSDQVATDVDVRVEVEVDNNETREEVKVDNNETREEVKTHNAKNAIGNVKNTVGNKVQLVPVTGNTIHKSQLAPSKTNLVGTSINNNRVNNAENNNPLITGNNVAENVNNGNEIVAPEAKPSNKLPPAGTEHGNETNNTNELTTAQNTTEEAPIEQQSVPEQPKATGLQRFFKKGK